MSTPSVATALTEPDASQPAKPAPVVAVDPIQVAPSAGEPSIPLAANPLAPPAAVVAPAPLPKPRSQVPVVSPVEQPTVISTGAPKVPLVAPTPVTPPAIPVKPALVAPPVEKEPTVSTPAPVEKASAATAPPVAKGASLFAAAAKGAPLFASAGSVMETSEVAAPPVPASTVTPFAQGAETPAGGVDMQAMVDAIRATVAIAARQGSTQARIALQPEELGGIRIHLSQTSDGLLARLVGETPAGAQALAAGRAELHRTLSSLGLPLLRMDIGSQSHSEANPRDERFAGRSDGGAFVGTPKQEEELDGPGDGAGIDNTSRPIELAGGGLVNVLA